MRENVEKNCPQYKWWKFMATTVKEATNKISGVSETLMITLYARYMESQR